MDNNLKLSIIIPTFKSYRTISKLVESLEQQVYNNYEIIIINDIVKNDKESEMNKKIVDELAYKYSNIITYDMPHTKYQGNARNEGMNLAKGEYITFADSDDYYSSDYFEKLIPAIDNNDFDVLTFNFCAINANCHHRIIKKKRKEKMQFKEFEGAHLFMQGYLCYTIANCCWNKIYRKKFIDENNLKFIENYKTREDYIFNIICFSKVSKLYNLNEDLYMYIEDENSDSRRFNQTYVDDMILNYTQLKKVLKDDPNYNRYIGLYYLKTILDFLNNEIINPNYEVGKENIKKYFENENIKKSLKSVKIRDFDYKLWIYYIIYKFHLYKLIYKKKYQK